MTEARAPLARRLELDWLRVLATAAVFIFHSTRFFDSMDWHVKNSIRYDTLDQIAAAVILWMMPLLFVVSGASIYYALKRRSGWEFLKDRLLRLGVPLTWGVLLLGAWQVYLERLTHGQIRGSFWEFYPHYFTGRYGEGGNFAWMGLHLWYMLELLVLSVLLLPLFLWLRRGGGRKVLDWLGGLLALPGAMYLLALPVMGVLVLINPTTFFGVRSFGGWSALSYLPLLINGFVLVAHTRLYERVRQWRWLSLMAGVALTVLLVSWYLKTGEPLWGTAAYTRLFAVYGLASWCCVLAVMGFAARHLTQAVPALAVANEAVLPFYILHQPVLLTVGWFVVRWKLSSLAKWGIIFVASLAITLGLYWLVIRPVNVLRLVFGMKAREKQA